MSAPFRRPLSTSRRGSGSAKSRFWPAAQYLPGRSQPSFDKQFVRDYLERIGWNKQPPAPELPAEIVEATSAKYREALRILTGRDLR
mgnify:CR=1 FL=1